MAQMVVLFLRFHCIWEYHTVYTPLCKIHCFLHCAVHMWSSASCNILWRSVSTAPTHVPNHCSSHGCCLIFYYVATSVITPFAQVVLIEPLQLPLVIYFYQ